MGIVFNVTVEKLMYGLPRPAAKALWEQMEAYNRIASLLGLDPDDGEAVERSITSLQAERDKLREQLRRGIPLSVAQTVVVENCVGCGGTGAITVTGTAMGPGGEPIPVPEQEQCEYCGRLCDALNEAAARAAEGGKG